MPPGSNSRLSTPLPRRLLCIGQGAPADCPAEEDVFVLAAQAVTAESLGSISPDLVVLPLMARDHDAVGVIEQLVRAGYRGACLVIAPALPNLAAIQTELQEGAPQVQIRLATTCPGADQADGLSRR